jgi:hypothetical protein
LLIELLGLTGPLVASHVASLDMQAAARFPVAWAGEEVSLNWFDVGRDYTERWHHQQQIRDAVGTAGLTSHYWMHPVLAIFMRALPHVYRDVRSQSGDAVEIGIEGDAGGIWSLTYSSGAWDLSAKNADQPLSRVRLDQDTAWRLFTKGITPDQARSRIRIEGSQQLGNPFLNAIAVMA